MILGAYRLSYLIPHRFISAHGGLRDMASLALGTYRGVFLLFQTRCDTMFPDSIHERASLGCGESGGYGQGRRPQLIVVCV
jgi:hypothetical protein